LGTKLITVNTLHVHGGLNCIDKESILLPRITFSSLLPSTSHTLLHRQFPLCAAYATTFNSCQGLTLHLRFLTLTTPVFSHRQLYTALSCVRHR
ncbi:hypothetical protein JB92DRAFT_2733104, partial [Gautieria morchelliformis]